MLNGKIDYVSLTAGSMVNFVVKTELLDEQELNELIEWLREFKVKASDEVEERLIEAALEYAQSFKD